MNRNYGAAAQARIGGNSAFCVLCAMVAAVVFTTNMKAQSANADVTSAEPAHNSESYKTIYLTNLAQQNDANDVMTAVRNMVPRAHVYFVASQDALTVHGTAEEVELAQKIVGDLDKVKKVYRLTYTITETDAGKRLEAKSYALVVASGGKTTLKLGSKVPIVTGSFDEGKSTANTQVQYQDVGLSIEAALDGHLDGVRLRSKVEQSSVAEEKSGMSPQDPVIRQNVLDDESTLVQGKPLVLGSLDMPGSTHKQEIAVEAELVR